MVSSPAETVPRFVVETRDETLPRAPPAAGARGLEGPRLLTAFGLGVEVASRVARALPRGHYLAGWHATATVGRLAGAAAPARPPGPHATTPAPPARPPRA